MKHLTKTIAKKLGILRVRRIIHRARFGFSYFRDSLAKFFIWVFKDSEDSNFYYDLKSRNEEYLVSLIANITGETPPAVQRYVDEIKMNQELKLRIKSALAETDYPADIDIRFGRRVGWYALIRILKPKLVIETGVDHGIGLSVICEALKLNRSEGFRGKYIGTDIDPLAGKLASPEYGDFAQIIYGDSIASLSNLTETIDLFINDSDHSAEYELSEYQTIIEKLSDRAVILGDNSHVTNKLLNFSNQNNRQFYFFKEEPLNHWYPGAGIGISIVQSKKF